jgi:hypothetical protein
MLSTLQRLERLRGYLGEQVAQSGDGVGRFTAGLQFKSGSGDQSIIVEYLLDEAGAAIPSLIGMSMVPSMLTVRSPMEVPAS